ncbi:uncharacterized protein MAL8P1.12-like [Linepithema humile]|uniref:uncharacterized protein MAL8P1.12-like n=1 Tax=Linepithema humile TaxID=83485 RepID=UPI0006235E8B|nr:PREDICTED: uncharacterized protein LOC105670703 [Linepithema humile]
MDKNNNSISTELSSQDERNKLLNEIAILKTYISLLETVIQTPKFSQLQIVEKPSRLLCDNKDAKFRKIPDVQTELCYEFYQFAGMQCVNCEGGFVFEFSSTENFSKNDLYAVEILIDDNGRGKVGKWVLPMSIDISEILSRYPIDDLNSIKHFLKSCKHHIDCYMNRKEQAEKLQNLLLEIKNAHVLYSVGITHIELTMSHLKDIDDNKFYNVILYLYYNSTEVRPCKLFSDTDSNEEPSSDLSKRLNKYFKPFLKRDLNLAFLKVSKSQNQFVWKKILVDSKENSIEIDDKSNDEDDFLTEFLHKSNKKYKKEKDKKQDKKNTLYKNKMETSFCVEGEKIQEDTAKDDFSEENKEIKSQKRKRSKKIVNSDKNKKKQSKKLLNKSNNTNAEHSANSGREENQLQKLTQSKRKKNDKRAIISNSTPISKKLPNQKFFHEISSIIE